MKLTQSPGWCLVLMGWWIVPFFAGALASHPIYREPSSYVPFAVAFVILGVSGFILERLNGTRRFWDRFSVRKRVELLVGAYALSAIAIVFLVVVLDSWGWVGYFGGDAGGSFGLLFFPSILAYLVLGATLVAVVALVRRQPPRGKGPS